MDKIAILGCGWLGLPLAKNLLEKGYQVKGSVSRAERLVILEDAGIDAYPIQLETPGVSGPITKFLAESDVLVIAVPPGLRKNPAGSFRKKIMQLVPLAKKSELRKIVFISSTSVYGEVNGPVNEKTFPLPQRTSAQELHETEVLLRTFFPETTVVRMGGLIGADRKPIRQLSGKKELKGRLWPVNLIQQQDAVGVLCQIIKEQLWGTVINGVYPSHPSKEAYYTKQAETAALPPPEFDPNDDSVGKQVDCTHEKLLDDFRFQHPI